MSRGIKRLIALLVSVMLCFGNIMTAYAANTRDNYVDTLHTPNDDNLKMHPGLYLVMAVDLANMGGKHTLVMPIYIHKTGLMNMSITDKNGSRTLTVSVDGVTGEWEFSGHEIDGTPKVTDRSFIESLYMQETNTTLPDTVNPYYIYNWQIPYDYKELPDFGGRVSYLYVYYQWLTAADKNGDENTIKSRVRDFGQGAVDLEDTDAGYVGMLNKVVSIYRDYYDSEIKNTDGHTWIAHIVKIIYDSVGKDKVEAGYKEYWDSLPNATEDYKIGAALTPDMEYYTPDRKLNNRGLSALYLLYSRYKEAGKIVEATDLGGNGADVSGNEQAGAESSTENAVLTGDKESKTWSLLQMIAYQIASQGDSKTIDQILTTVKKMDGASEILASTNGSSGSITLEEAIKSEDTVIVTWLDTWVANLAGNGSASGNRTLIGRRNILGFMSIAYMRGTNDVIDRWAHEGDSYVAYRMAFANYRTSIGVHGNIKGNDTGTYENSADIGATVNDLQRMKTFRARLRSLKDYAFNTGDQATKDMVKMYYEDNQYVNAIPFQDTGNGTDFFYTIPALEYNNTGGVNMLVLDSSDKSAEGLLSYNMGPAYMLRTAYELPYFVIYCNEEIYEAYQNGNVMQKADIVNAVNSIKAAVDESGWNLLEYLWKMEVNAEDYKIDGEVLTLKGGTSFNSMQKIWEAIQNDESFIDSVDDTTPIDDGTGDEETLQESKVLPWFFKDYTFVSGGNSTGQLSDEYIQGIAYTAMLVPMKSNVYSQEWQNLIQGTFYEDFYKEWGFHRKALYIDLSAGAGEAFYNSGKVSKGDTKVCTLRDIVEAADDVVLYLDDNFYNVAELNANDSLVQTYLVNQPQEADAGLLSTFWYNYTAPLVEESYNTSFDEIMKTGASLNYSKPFYELMNKFNNSHKYYSNATVDNPGNEDGAVLSSGKINYYLDPEQTGSEVYTPLQGYALVSSIYRDGSMYSLANSREVRYPVFVASDSAAFATGATNEMMSTIFNWALIKNLEESMPIGYTGNLDYDCPVYMDILGNIVTESGTVVVPAMANATLMDTDEFIPVQPGAGLWAIYGSGYRIPYETSTRAQQKYEKLYTFLGYTMTPNEDEKCFVPKARKFELNDSSIDMSRISIQDKDTLQQLSDYAYNYILKSHNSGDTFYNFPAYVNVCLEVMRGAPIENIDKEVEGLGVTKSVDRSGIVAAAKLEELNNSLKSAGENTTIALPNLAFMPGFNYIALLVFKVLVLVVIIVNMSIVYIDATSESLSLGTIWRCLSSIIITMLTVMTVPALFEATYYQSNRALLQDESTLISMLNLEKEESGVEIGVTEIREPQIDTELYLKLQRIDVPWYNLFYNSITTDSYKTLNQLYETYAKEHSAISFMDDVEVKNDGVYISVADVYKSSSVDFRMNQEVKELVQTAGTKTTTFSFYSPYYAILDALIRNVNYFNANPWDEDQENTATKGWYAYSIKEQSGGRIKTVGLAEQYFKSSRFMESTDRDITGMRTAYRNIATFDQSLDMATGTLFSDADRAAFENAYWYPTGISETELEKRVEYLEKEARVFVSKYKDLLGKISDETFLKVMAMHLAVEHNKIFGCEYASTYEIYNLSNDDLMRLSIADRSDVMTTSTLSYPRFVYSVGGTPTVFAAAVLTMIMWVSGLVKPILVIVAFITIFISVFVFKVCMRKPGTSLYGYFITALLLGATNILYSVILKLSMFLPTIGMTPFMCVIIQCIIQIVYMIVLLSVVWTAFKDWRDLGMTRYANKMQDMQVGMFKFLNRKNKNADNPFYGGTTKQSTPEKNWEYYDNMIDERRNRMR